MEYHETPRIAATEGRLDGVIGQSEPRPLLHRFELIRAPRQHDLPRVIAAFLLLLVGLLVLGYLCMQAVHLAVRWLHDRPEYQLPFEEIKLAETPPAWFRGGAEAFLKQVRENIGEAETLPVMDLKPDRIEQDFKLFHWVEQVRRVEYPPRGITVHLDYKKPVALISIRGGSDPAVLDRDGDVLPADDIDTEKLGPLIKITGRGLVASSENRPGMHWKSGAQGAEAKRVERGVKDAASLASFLLNPSRADEMATIPGLQNIYIHIPIDHRGLFLQTASAAFILWGESPGEEAKSALTAEGKWEILKEWAKAPARRSLPEGHYWTFSGTELIPVETRPDR
jgi:hypothetical protein